MNLPGNNYEKSFAILINWARYGELFDYDDKTGQITNEPHGP
jgi:hypothetical protein